MPTRIPFYTTKYLFARVENWLTDLMRMQPNIQTALDAPAGAGALTQVLHEDLKLSVEAIEIDPSKWQYPKVKVQVADLGRPLPFQNKSFDLIVCLEGLKHFTDVSTAIAEFNRCLKDDGFLLLTIPNDLCMQSRIRYLIDGWVDTDWIKPMDPQSHDEKDHVHLNSLVSLPYLYYFFQKNKLQIVRTGTCHLRFWSVLLSIAFYPLIFLATLRKLSWRHPLCREMLSLTWLAGRRNLILLRKGLVDA
jgi:SAM-dependent methyltransferase